MQLQTYNMWGWLAHWDARLGLMQVINVDIHCLQVGLDIFTIGS